MSKFWGTCEWNGCSSKLLTRHISFFFFFFFFEFGVMARLVILSQYRGAHSFHRRGLLPEILNVLSDLMASMTKLTVEASTALVPVTPVVTGVTIVHCVYCIQEAVLISSPPQSFVHPSYHISWWQKIKNFKTGALITAKLSHKSSSEPIWRFLHWNLG
jgi:hypothetical protein